MSQELFDLARQRQQAGRLQDADLLYRQFLMQQPDHVEAMQSLGILCAQTGRPQAAVELLRKVAAALPDSPEACSNLANVLESCGRHDEAIASYRKAIALRPDFVQAYSNMSNALRSTGRYDEAIAAARQALAIRPDHAPAYNNLGHALQTKGLWDQALAAYRQALALRPDLSVVHSNLANMLCLRGQFDQAIDACLKALALRPHFPEAYLTLGNAMKDTARLDDALAAYDRALSLEPDHLAAAMNRLFALHFHPDYDAKAILREHQKWNQRFAQPLAAAIQPHANDRNPDRRLKIGYVSPDFCNHCQSFFTTPLLSHHHHEQFEVFCYASVERPDQLTQRLRGYADVWRDCLGQSDADVAQMIRQDQIDILVDLTMHMANGRPLVFARKPAPVQVAWLAYPGTTGMTAMDYRLTDPYLDPPDADAHYVEKSIRLPDTFWCYDPLTDQPPVNALPALSVGHVTFGCLNNFCKVNAGTLELWSQVLSAVPGSRLILLCPQGSHRPQVLEKLKVQADRVEFVEFAPREQYLKRYHRIDIGLDTFPYNGHTTSLDSLWMGVPVVSMVGQRAVSRAGWSQSKNLGLAEQLVGQRPQDFVSLAVGLAGDLPRLSQMRGQLRLRMEKSPLMDADRFARKVEEAYRQMWHTFMNSTA
ncbi:MAG: tetratricopeptide repeat protein [Tepidisphaeraceae bacterium]|jgi:predicted O-linked N-acetylglucosamine transferase (SPINDLY family)